MRQSSHCPTFESSNMVSDSTTLVYSHTTKIPNTMFCLAPKTRYSYNKVLSIQEELCIVNKVPFPPSDTDVLADFLCLVSDMSSRPSAVLQTASATIGHTYKGLQLTNTVDCPETRNLITGLIKSGSSIPIKCQRSCQSRISRICFNLAGKQYVDFQILKNEGY